MKKQIKFSIKGWHKPTPATFRRIGDALLAVTLFVTPISVFMDMKGVAVAMLIIGVVGKFLTKFFSEEYPK